MPIPRTLLSLWPLLAALAIVVGLFPANMHQAARASGIARGRWLVTDSGIDAT